MTVQLSTNDMLDNEEARPRMMIIDAGCILYDGPAAALKEQFLSYWVLVMEFADWISDGAAR